jgi:hypothetical protein
VRRERRSVYCTISFSVCSRRRIELPIIYISSAQIFASTTNLQHCRQSTMSTPKKSRNENEKRFQAEIAKKEKKLKRKSKQ